MLTVSLRSAPDVPIEDLPVTGLEPGENSDVLELRLANLTGSEMRNVLIVMRTESLTVPGTAVATGVPPQDERWGRTRIVSVDATGEPGWRLAATSYRPMGAYTGILIDRIPDECAVNVDHHFRPPGSAVSLAEYRWYLLGIGAEYSQPIAPSLGDVTRGILVGKSAGVVRGCELTATGTPDDEVHVAAGIVEGETGALVGRISSAHELNQNDSAAAALATGESYYAAVTINAAGAGVITKGTKGATPSKPTPPAGILLGWVTVQYGVSGSVIEPEDIELVDAYGRHLCVAGSGLEAKIHAGQSITRTSWTYRADPALVPLAASDTSYLWRLTNGAWSATLDETAPEEDAQLNWEVTTDGSGVTGTPVDRRTYATDQVAITLRGLGADGLGAIASALVEFDELVIEDVVARIEGASGAADGTLLDVHVGGVTIYTDAATEDLRPAIAFDATGADLIHRGSVHQVTRVRRGDLVELHAIEYPDSDASPPDWVEVTLICRRPR